MSQLSTRHLLGIKDITETDIRLILETAANFKEVINRPIKKGKFDQNPPFLRIGRKAAQR